MGNDAVEDIKDRLSIEDVISRYIELKRAGHNFRGLSPFTNEKTPSFMVSPEKQIWHDFSSGKGGNMFSFVMEMEGVDFKDALQMLARQAGIDLSRYQKSSTTRRGANKDRLSQALELATKFYQAHLKKNQAALDYIIKKRGINKQTALDFKIGYAPDGADVLTKFLLSKGFSISELKLAGLSTQRYSQPGDMFHGRIMIPLMDTFGKVVGFTARILENNYSQAGNAPKYINTPQTVLYDKSRHVFGLHLAKEAIRQSGFAVIVEGNMDVIASHQAGVKQVVATAGTAITQQHLKIISHLSSDVRLAFDQDDAGLKATERAVPIASKVGVSLGIINVKDAKDPDELIKKDLKLWRQSVDDPQYALDWLISRYQTMLDLDSAKGKREFTDILLKVVRGLSDSVEQDHYITILAKLINVSEDALRSKLKGITQNRATPLFKPNNVALQQESKDIRELIKAQNHFLAIMLMQPGLRMYIKNLNDYVLPEETAKNLLKIIKQHPKMSGGEITLQLKSKPALEEFAQIVLLLYEELYKGLELLDLRSEAAQLQARLIQQYVKTKKTMLANEMRQSGETSNLLEQAKKLDQLLNSIKERINV